ncbi:SRPBCC family protein [Gluconacetobacter takamatsuzukensis]|uniref:SRPBCC family protein n=1 Tax=Gluconacetobacter takamatsuzukensis TaxID=1286190 RepID=A0A7W4PSL3_9PROT|nr:SRPBCC family protein [Gluconacetobacter takamatsuzukensis]MBB2206544.1 SRPBCC family protein [Gluconacetobacter takamatsuzukensis]
MVEITSQMNVAVSADTAWALLGGFDSLPLWIPMIRTSVLEDGGRIRRLTLADGTTITERLIRFDDRARMYSYAYLSGPDPVEDYVGQVAVTEQGPDRCLIGWGSRFVPVGLSEADATARYHAAYTAALTHARDLLEGAA